MATTWTNESKKGVAVDAFSLSIGDGFSLLIDSTYKLEIQAESTATTWSNQSKS